MNFEQILININEFEQILTKSDQILTIYVKNHQIHVKKIQGRHFPTKKKKLRECQHIAQGLGYWVFGWVLGGKFIH